MPFVYQGGLVRRGPCNSHIGAGLESQLLHGRSGLRRHGCTFAFTSTYMRGSIHEGEEVFPKQVDGCWEESELSAFKLPRRVSQQEIEVSQEISAFKWPKRSKGQRC